MSDTLKKFGFKLEYVFIGMTFKLGVTLRENNMLNYIELLNLHQGSMELFSISAYISRACKLIPIFILPL